jgi:glyoxylate reductase
VSRIVVLGPLPQAGLDRLASAGEVWVWNESAPMPDAVRNSQLATADAALTLLTHRVDSSFLDAAPLLEIIANVAVGYSNIDVATCRERGVVVTNTPGVLTDATADLAMALILMVTRRLGEGERLIRSRKPWKWDMFMLLGSGLQGRTLGIIGMGEVGQAVAHRARAFGMSVVYFNRRPVATTIETRLGTVRVELDELLATSDVVSVHCPYSDSTHHLIDAAALACMKPTSFLVNTARGSVVDEAALVRALSSGTIAGAALDVFENEPEVHPGLISLDNVVLLPHLGSATNETRRAMAELAAANVLEVLAGREPLTPVGG